MLKEVLTSRLFLFSLACLILIVAGCTLYLWHLERSVARESAEVLSPSADGGKNAHTGGDEHQGALSNEPTVPSTQGGHWHGDEWHAEPHEAHRDAPADAHDPPVRVPPRPGPLKPLPDELVRQMFKNQKIRRADTRAERKRQALENPSLLWQPFFIIPDPADHHNPPGLGELWDYTTVADAVTHSDSQNKRWDKVALEIEKKQQAGTLTPAEEKRLDRKKDEIEVEGLDPLTVAKYCLRYHTVEGLALEYASRAVRKAPKSTEARHVLGLVLERMNKNSEAVAVYRQMLALDENSSIALRELAWHLRATHPQEALGYIQKAIQLDARIPPYNTLLGECYEYLGQYDKALEVYQNMPSVDQFTKLHLISIQIGDPEIKPVVSE